MGSETRRKTKLVMVRMEPESYEQALELANACDISVPELCRILLNGYTPKSNVDIQHRERVAQLHGDLGRIGGLLKMWLATEPKKEYGRQLNIPDLVNELRRTQETVKEAFEHDRTRH